MRQERTPTFDYTALCLADVGEQPGAGCVRQWYGRIVVQKIAVVSVTLQERGDVLRLAGLGYNDQEELRPDGQAETLCITRSLCC